MNDLANTHKIAAIVLSFSREEDLKKVIFSLKNQTRELDEIIVIFQGTNPKILEWLNAQTGITVKQQGNIGSAGGFTSGLKMSIAKGYHWTWLLDDDAIPELNALEEMTICPYFDYKKTSLLSSVVMNPNREVYMSPAAMNSNLWYGNVMQDGCVPIYGSSWIGCLISSQSVIDFGLPVEEFFMYDEDAEFTSRVASQRSAYCVIKSIVIHYQKGSFDPFKNKVDMLKHGYYVRNHFALIRLSNNPAYVKLAKIWIWFFKNAFEIATRKVPFKTIISLMNGLIFFRPKIKPHTYD